MIAAGFWSGRDFPFTPFKEARMLVEVLKPFPFSRDGITEEQAVAGVPADIPENLIPGLERAKYIRQTKALAGAPENKADAGAEPKADPAASAADAATTTGSADASATDPANATAGAAAETGADPVVGADAADAADAEAKSKKGGKA